MNKKNAVITLTTALLIAVTAVLSFGGDADPVQSRDDWKQEYAAACADTGNAMALPAEELQGRIDRCDALRARLEQLDETHATAKKVYLKRLRMCRDLYVFALEFKREQ